MSDHPILDNDTCYEMPAVYGHDLVAHVEAQLTIRLRYHARMCNRCRLQSRLKVFDLYRCFAGAIEYAMDHPDDDLGE